MAKTTFFLTFNESIFLLDKKKGGYGGGEVRFGRRKARKGNLPYEIGSNLTKYDIIRSFILSPAFSGHKLGGINQLPNDICS